MHHTVIDVHRRAQVPEVAGRNRDGGLSGVGGVLAPAAVAPMAGRRRPALLVQFRTDRPRWGPRRLVHEVGRRGAGAVARTVYRVPLAPLPRRGEGSETTREDYVPWERPRLMQPWVSEQVLTDVLTQRAAAHNASDRNHPATELSHSPYL